MVLKHKTDACSNQHQATLVITKQMAAQSSNIDDLANNDGSVTEILTQIPKVQMYGADSWLVTHLRLPPSPSSSDHCGNTTLKPTISDQFGDGSLLALRKFTTSYI